MGTTFRIGSGALNPPVWLAKTAARRKNHHADPKHRTFAITGLSKPGSATPNLGERLAQNPQNLAAVSHAFYEASLGVPPPPLNPSLWAGASHSRRLLLGRHN